ncbi:sodium/calcium exchanger protein [Cordyceps fumosorosea ARSEF 2679]|uniref:Sodium/calcium exchanger protein n=1 Tax=Cordyceps fumosorosea (strain ARSEF 2679) TaxID=1081104 RepID=A0A162JIG6_CORFA|nr:sodium/calcium exchanger protein [Cordyceps fumosorosea ARSEF 2679]OAA69482.1 sodium/calcium exchanger protein [Cordyceps fumosorosea ARSEF 2679]
MAAVLARGRRRLSTWPFTITLLIISILSAYAFLIRTHHHAVPRALSSDLAPHLVSRSNQADPECRDVRLVEDQCAFVKKYCLDDDAGLISYLDLYYCKLNHVQPLAFVLIVLWLGMLFTTIGIAASDFFSINLSTIATILRLSESFAGVTFLALGNGSPDVFSTLAAMASNSASMAVGELLGAACFISGVVAGSMALVREFKVDRRSYVRDICFLIFAVVFTMIFLADGSLHFWECWAMIAFYLLYVATVVGWHWYFSRRKLRLRREGEARSHFYGSANQANDELAGEPYRDDPDDADRTHGSRERARPDISALESSPRVEFEGQDWDEVADEQAQDHERMVAAEVSRSMRVLRPSRPRRNTKTPIRPSLVGALEFRSALAQLQRESNWQLSNMPSRSHSVHHIPHLRERGASFAEPSTVSRSHPDPHFEPGPYGRERGFSVSTVPGVITESEDAVSDSEQGSEQLSGPMKAPSPSASYTVGGNLAPPPTNASSAPTSSAAKGQSDKQLPLLIVRPPTRQGGHSEGSAPGSPFPQYTDSPVLLTPTPNAEPSEFMLPSPASGRRPELPGPLRDCDCIVEPKPVSWWPYSILPPPHIILATLFPTLQGWGTKTWWDRFVSAISVPSIFLLVLTLPVVEPEEDEDEHTDVTIASQSGHEVIVSDVDRFSQENGRQEGVAEWERYRNYQSRRTSHSSSCLQSPQLPALTNDNTLVSPCTVGAASAAVANKAASDLTSAGNNGADPGTWNRWLVCVQLFTGPLFAVFILWVNQLDDWENPRKTLVKMVLYSLLLSLVLLAILVIVTVEHIRPKYHYILCFLGFVISIAWISTIAGEVVGVLQTLGVVLDISEALLGLTIFAAGNSVGDLVADITVARLGHPVMALSACFGGPLLNILLGIGIGGVLMMIQGANHERGKHPDRPVHYGPYPVEIGGTLLVSSMTLLVILSGLLIAVPMNKWVLSRKIGWALIAVWSVSTAVNVAMEVSGVWGGSKS